MNMVTSVAFDFSNSSTDELVEAYNACQLELGGQIIEGFPNREEAERKTKFALSQIVDPTKRPGKFAARDAMRSTRRVRALVNGQEVAFSQKELDLLDLLPKNGDRITSVELVEKYYGIDPPINARVIVVGRLRGIATKAKRSGLDWKLKKSKRAGPNPQSFWIEHGK